MTCIGASGPLIDEVSRAVREGVTVVSVLSGNRNFEGRIQPEVAMNYLASPPLVIAYAIAGTMTSTWPPNHWAMRRMVARSSSQTCGPSPTRSTTSSPAACRPTCSPVRIGTCSAAISDGATSMSPTVICSRGTRPRLHPPPALPGRHGLEPSPVRDIHAARVLVKLGDLVTTDHISPAGAITLGTPAWEYLAERGVTSRDINTYASRRGNHEVMMRGAFANVRLQNQFAPGTRGGRTRNFLDDGCETTIFDAATAIGKPMFQRWSWQARTTGAGPRATGRPRARATGRPGRHRTILRADPPLQPRGHGSGPARAGGCRTRRRGAIRGRRNQHHRTTCTQRRRDTVPRHYPQQWQQFQRTATPGHRARGRLHPPRGSMPYVLRDLLNKGRGEGS